MISTKLENGLESNFFGFFMKVMNPLEKDYFHTLLIRSVEKSLKNLGGEIYAPDSYNIDVDFGSLNTVSSLDGYIKKIENILKNYITDSGYGLLCDLKVNLNIVESLINPRIHAGFQKPVNSGAMRIFVTNISRNDIDYSSVDLQNDKKCLIGRSSTTELKINNPYISGHHAVIKSNSSGRLLIMDLNSKNGTVLNGRHLETNIDYPVKQGDELLISGKFKITFKQLGN